MNAEKRSFYKFSLTKSAAPAWCLAFALVFSLSTVVNKGQAAPCFDNAQNAYNYLLTQEDLENQALSQNSVNINRASEGELTSLKGIGSSKAQAIVLYREMFGDFKSIDELAKVRGIGAKTIEKNRSRLQL
ncbi:ComEA family DNA-binding protein [Psychrobacter sp. TAE2020]|uniref:ComEA family DNA-binding protein n=1 Tax=Psychrobacter sp. TAE2020 TaxID=2846762 RepID=UPI001C103D56|nr:ComEA family DNA-binding protein [Psychrobacter sp. TAE2020]MBU5616987.1 ComEA family DNA-binding protein [Psychrobacter sp. TAE2020]